MRSKNTHDYEIKAGDYTYFARWKDDHYEWSKKLLNTAGATEELIELCELPVEVAHAFAQARVRDFQAPPA